MSPTTTARPVIPGTHAPAKWWHAIEDGRLECDLCPRACRLREGQRGYCFVRARQDDRMVLTTYGRSSGFCIDPIEKKPLNHFRPGTSVLSFGTAGCNLGCRFCQNWDITTARRMDRLMDTATPAMISKAATDWRCPTVAFTYNDPVIFAEYAIDVARACHQQGVSTVAVTAGYVSEGARREFFSVMDAANVDLKGFDEDFCFRQTGGQLKPVLDTLVYLKHQTRVWFEITNLLIPGANDDSASLRAMTRWIVDELGPDVPLHFSAFHPDHKLTDVGRTPPATLRRARDIALEEGLHYVYTGNVHDPAGDTTYCPGCGCKVIERDWYTIKRYRLTPEGRCPECRVAIAGRFGERPGDFGQRRIPIRLGE